MIELIPGWRDVWHRLWTVRIAILWAVVAGLWVALPALQSLVPPIPFVCLCIAFSLAILFARLTNQPGLPNV